MKKLIKPVPNGNEIILDPTKVIMSKTDYKGIIQYANDYFVEVCGYKAYELMGKPHNIIRHPDMPKVIFKFMWEQLHKGENIYAAVKNLAKDGSYYWVMTYFETKYDSNGNILAHYARRKAIPLKAKQVFEELYLKILKIEKQNPIAAEKYFYGFIEDSKKEYNELFLSILEISKEEFTNYFSKKELNINDKTELKIKDQPETINTKTESEVTSDIEKLKKEIEQLKSDLNNKNMPKKKGLLSRLFSKK
jgi:PAS domain S-box-containing protein